MYYYVRCSICSRVNTSANGCTLVFVYMTYTMLPVRLREALIGGLVLSLTHFYLSASAASDVQWTQVSGWMEYVYCIVCARVL